MEQLLLSLLIAMLLPYLAKAPLAFAMQKAGGYDISLRASGAGRFSARPRADRV